MKQSTEALRIINTFKVKYKYHVIGLDCNDKQRIISISKLTYNAILSHAFNQKPLGYLIVSSTTTDNYKYINNTLAAIKFRPNLCIIPGVCYKNKKKGTLYMVMDISSNTTNAQDGQTIIYYRPLPNPTNDTYVREYNEFCIKFKVA